MTTTETKSFGRYGHLAVGEARYASIVPHHDIFDEHGERRPRWEGAAYTNTFCSATEELLCRIFDDRDPTANATVPVVWRGRDGEDGEYFLWRQVGGFDDMVPLPGCCVEWFTADLTEEEEKPAWWDNDEDGEFSPELTQTCFEATVRGALE